VKLVRLHSEQQDWQELVDTLVRLSEIGTEPREKAMSLRVAARVTAKERRDPAAAIRLFDRALACDPGWEELARETITLRAELGDTAGIRQILEQQIHIASMANDKPRAMRLATELADLHLSELRIDDAIAVNEAALRLAGSDPERENVLAELYASDPVRYLDRGATQMRKILERDPFAVEAYRRLRELAVGAKRRDAAFCASQALVALDAAGPDESASVLRFKRRGPLPAEAKLTSDDWDRYVMHPDADPTLTRLFAALEPLISAAVARPLAAIGFTPEDAMDLSTASAVDATKGEGTVAAAIAAAARTLGLPPPLVFATKDAHALRLGHTQPRSLLVGQAALTARVPRRQATFVAGAHVAYLRPGLHARTLMNIDSAKAWLLAATRVVAPKLPVAKELETQVAAAERVLSQHVDEPVGRAVTAIVKEMLDSGARADLHAWLRGIDLTSDRAGFIACDDLPVALSVLRATGDANASRTVTEGAGELLRYSVGSQYLTLRDHLRIGVDWTGRAQGTEPRPGATA
jgi:hypothetical protein